MDYMQSICRDTRHPTGEPFASTVVVVVAGVMCRGARWGVHLPWAVTYSHIVAPLRAQGVPVEIWAFNNIPPSIDGCAVPADGGKSLFGVMDYYESYWQHDIDASSDVRRIIALQSVVGLTNQHSSFNIARVLFLEGRACARLRSEIESHRLPPDTVVYMVSPDLLYAEPRMLLPARDTDPGRLWVMGKLDHVEEVNREGIENGWLAGRASSIVRFHESRMLLTTSVRATYYESWLWQLLRDVTIDYVVSPSRAMQVHVIARCLRGYAPPPPWEWQTTGDNYGMCTWQQFPKAILLRAVEVLGHYEPVPAQPSLTDARTWVPLERNLVGLVTNEYYFTMHTAGTSLHAMTLPVADGYIIEWCGGATVRLRCLRTGLFLARNRHDDGLVGSTSSDSMSVFSCRRSSGTSWKSDDWCLSHGSSNVGFTPRSRSLQMVPAHTELHPTVVLRAAEVDILCPKMQLVPRSGGGIPSLIFSS